MSEVMTLERMRDWHRYVNVNWAHLNLHERMELVTSFPHGAAANFIDAHLAKAGDGVESGAETEAEGVYVEPDGCPTELAVLQRFWREKQNKFSSLNEALASTLDHRNSPKYDGSLGSVRKDNDAE